MTLPHLAIRSLGGCSPSIANDAFESLRSRNAAARAINSLGALLTICFALLDRSAEIKRSIALVLNTNGQKKGIPGRLSRILNRFSLKCLFVPYCLLVSGLCAGHGCEKSSHSG